MIGLDSTTWEKLMKLLVAGRHMAFCSQSSMKQTNSTETMDLKLGEAVEASQKSPKDRIWGSSS